MKRGRRLLGIMAMAVLVLVAVAAISWAGVPDIVTIKNAIFVPSEGKWRVMGKAAPGNTVTVYLGGNVIGTSAPAKDNGRWRVFINRSSVVAHPGDVITATSSGGGAAADAVLIR